jgi:hypothetical protein
MVRPVYSTLLMAHAESIVVVVVVVVVIIIVNALHAQLPKHITCVFYECLYENVSKSFHTESITKYTLPTINTR